MERRRGKVEKRNDFSIRLKTGEPLEQRCRESFVAGLGRKNVRKIIIFYINV